MSLEPSSHPANATGEWIENLTFEELAIGQSGRLLRTLTPDDILAFAAVSGDTNPAHLSPEYANATLFHGVIAHGMWGGALISALLGTRFPGPGTIYLEQVLHFSKPVRIGDTLTVIATVSALEVERKRVELDCQVLNQRGERVLHGTARVLAPTQKVRLPRLHAPQIQLFDPLARFRELMALGDGMPPVRCAVVHPCDADVLAGVVEAARQGVMDPVLIGPVQRLRRLAEAAAIDLRGFELVDVPHSHAAAEHAARLAAGGEVAALMKGSLATGELVQALLERPELRTGRRLSHICRFDVPLYSKPLFITDAVLNVRPDLLRKADIVRNAIDCARILGVEQPRIALLSASETVHPEIPSSLDAAALCKMADRGQITGGMLDGPLPFDCAVAVRPVGGRPMSSPVAGQADVLVAPDLESGSLLVRQLQYLAGATASGVVMGARVPVALCTQADGPASWVASALLAQLVAHAQGRREKEKDTAWAVTA